MQVTHQNNHVTHAVIGSKQSIEYGISDSAEFFNILSSTLYKDQILAVVRETLCNAWDAHIDAGITDKPIQVTLTSDTFTIKDFGKGIHNDDIGPIYAVYGNSTKKSDGTQTGGFGLGCKAPFAYTDHFEVVSCHDGVKSIYSMSRSSAKAAGKPEINHIASVPCGEERGLTVTIRIAHSDKPRFNELVQRIAFQGDLSIVLNGETLPTLGFDKASNNYMVVCKRLLGSAAHPIFVRYGNVIYPVEPNEESKIAYDQIRTHLSKISGNGAYYSLILQAPPHSISVTPSREALSMKEHTVKTLLKLMHDFLKVIKGDFPAACKEIAQQATDLAIQNANIGQLLKTEYAIPYADDNKDKPATITDKMTMATAYLQYDYPNEPHFRKEDVKYRLTKMAASSVLNKGAVQTFLKDMENVAVPPNKGYWDGENEMSSWLQRRVVTPLLKKLMKASMDISRLFVLDSVFEYQHNKDELCLATKVPKIAHMRCLPYMRNIVVLTSRRTTLRKDVQRHPKFKALGGYDGFFVYLLSRKVNEASAQRDFFNKSGMVVVDLTELEDTEAKPKTSSTPRKPAKKGLVCVSELVRNGRFNGSNIQDEKSSRIEDPEFVVRMTVQDYSSSYSFSGWNQESSISIVTLFGDKGGVTASSTSHKRYLERGAVEMNEYVAQKVCKFILDNPNIKNSLAFNKGKIFDAVEGINYEAVRFAKYVMESKELKTLFGLHVQLSAVEEAHMKIFDYMVGRNTTSADIFKDANKYCRGIPLSPAALEFIKKVGASKYVPFINTDRLVTKLEATNTPNKATEHKQLLEIASHIVNN